MEKQSRQSQKKGITLKVQHKLCHNLNHFHHFNYLSQFSHLSKCAGSDIIFCSVIPMSKLYLVFNAQPSHFTQSCMQSFTGLLLQRHNHHYWDSCMLVSISSFYWQRMGRSRAIVHKLFSLFNDAQYSWRNCTNYFRTLWNTFFFVLQLY